MTTFDWLLLIGTAFCVGASAGTCWAWRRSNEVIAVWKRAARDWREAAGPGELTPESQYRLDRWPSHLQGLPFCYAADGRPIYDKNEADELRAADHERWRLADLEDEPEAKS